MAPQQQGDDHDEEADAHPNPGMIMSGPAAPILKSFLGFGATAAYAQDDDDQGENDDSDGQ